METKTTVKEVDMNIDELLGNSVMTTEDQKPSIFTNKPVDLSFLDNSSGNTEDIVTDPAEPVEPTNPTDPIIDPLNDLTIPDNKQSTPGRKQGLQELVSKLLDKKVFVPFDDDKPMDKYTMQDYEELIEANIQERENKIKKTYREELFKSLPDEMKAVYRYVSSGGTDLKMVFRQLADQQEILELNPENDAETIVRTYLQATNFGNQDEIQEEIDSWKDHNELEAKAKKFKPKLEAMQEEIMEYNLQKQEQMLKQRQEQAALYEENIYKLLEKGNLGDIKVDKKTQGMLFYGLTDNKYQSVTGRQTNLLGHLLEKYQFLEPDHTKIMKVLWLLQDEEGYNAKVRENAKKEVVTDTVRTLKSEESRKINSGIEEDEETMRKKKVGITRPSGKKFFSSFD